MEQCSDNVVKKIYQYSAFGLRINSEITLPELPTVAGGVADIIIRYGEVPDKIDSPLEETYYYQATADEFLFRVDGVAIYYITNGEQVRVQPCIQADFRVGRQYLLGTVMGIVLMQRGIVPIHGSTVVINGCGVIFTGISGAGKSTMAAALHKRGYSLLADDVSAVKCDQNGVFWGQPGYPQQKLCQVSASMLGINTAVFDRICEDRDKYVVPLVTGFSRLPIPIAAVYEIVEKTCVDVSIVPLKGVAKLAAIMGNAYRGEFVNGLGIKHAHFKQCANLAKQIQVYRLTRPSGILSLDRQLEIVQQHSANFCSSSLKQQEGIAGNAML